MFCVFSIFQHFYLLLSCFFAFYLRSEIQKLMKKGLLLLLLGMYALFAYAGAPIIIVRNGGVPTEGDQPDPRSIESVVTASIDSQVITVLFSELTTSQIVVKDSADLTVFNQTYASAYSVQANLSALPSGSYTLHIFALGSWWYGYFEIE